MPSSAPHPFSSQQRMQSVHLPLYHQALYPEEIVQVLRETMPQGGGLIAVGCPAEVDLTVDGGLPRLGTDMLAWYAAADPSVPARMRVICTPVTEAPLPIRRQAGSAGFALFGAGLQRDALRRALHEAAAATGASSVRYDLACFDGGLVLFDQELRQDLPRDLSPVGLRDWMQAHLGGYMALVRDRSASPRVTVRFLTGVDRIVKTLLPGYLRMLPDRLFDAALEGVRILPCRQPQDKLRLDSSAA